MGDREREREREHSSMEVQWGACSGDMTTLPPPTPYNRSRYQLYQGSNKTKINPVRLFLAFLRPPDGVGVRSVIVGPSDCPSRSVRDRPDLCLVLPVVCYFVIRCGYITTPRVAMAGLISHIKGFRFRASTPPVFVLFAAFTFVYFPALLTMPVSSQNTKQVPGGGIAFVEHAAAARNRRNRTARFVAEELRGSKRSHTSFSIEQARDGCYSAAETVADEVGVATFGDRRIKRGISSRTLR